MRPLLPALLACAVLAACSKEPSGMLRLDPGETNHKFRVDSSHRHLYYVKGAGEQAALLGVMDLDTGRRDAYRFKHLKIADLRVSPAQDMVKLLAEGTAADNEGEFHLLLVSPDGRIKQDQRRDDPSPDALAAFGEPPAAKPFAPPPAVRGRRPDLTVPGPDGKIFAATGGPDESWHVEEIQPNGKRRLLATFAGRVESMAAAGVGLAVVRETRGAGGLRMLAMVNATTAAVDFELPWNEGECEILAADATKRLLYLRMNEGSFESAWAVRFDEPALRAASEFLARRRGPETFNITVLDAIGILVVAGLLILGGGMLAAPK